MIITKLALPRRTFLRGTSVALAMPLLDAMVPALSALARSAAAPVPRLAICGMSNGIYRPTFRPPSGGETDFTMSRTLAPLAPFRDQLVIVDGLSNAAADTAESAGGPHARANSTFLTGVRAKRTEGADVHLGKSFDQYAADTLGVETPLRSLELQLESSYSGICDTGYSCAYTNTYAWRTATQPLPMEINPRMVFERLFGDAGSVKAQQIQMRRDRSVLDWVQGELSGLQKRLGASDQHTLNDYLDSVRDVELRIQKAEKRSETTELPEVIKPRGIPDTVDEHVKLMFDLQLLAFQADITRGGHIPDDTGAGHDHLPGARRDRWAPQHLPPREQPGQLRAADEAAHLLREPSRALCGEAPRHAGRRRESPRSRDGDVQRRPGRRRCTQRAQSAGRDCRRRVRPAAGRAVHGV